MNAQTKPPIDYAGHLDTLERRADYLSRIVHPEPGSPVRRSAHWRDEAELKAIRHSIKAIRRERDAKSRNELILQALDLAAERIDRDSNPFAATVIDEARTAMRELDGR